MFASLKNKIKEETGSEGLLPHQRTMIHPATTNNNNNRLKGSSNISVTSNDESQVNDKI